MKVLVTGASGYLGGHICHAVAKEGYAVRALVRRSSVLDHLQQEEVEIVYGDVTDLPSLLEACNGCDILIHAAALVCPWLPDPSNFSTHQSQSQSQSWGADYDYCSSSMVVNEASRSGKRPRATLAPSPHSNPKCQVDDCKVDLNTAKDYHRRHKVCETHAKANKALVGRLIQR